MTHKKRWLWIAALLLIITTIIWNFPVSYKVGVDGRLFEKKIPLYAKACGFLYRDWMYKDIVNEIIDKNEGEIAKVLAILRWTNANIKYEIPQGLKVMDDHPLNIIIRQYGAKDQIEDVFTILCSYAGMRAGRIKCYNLNKTRSIIFSVVDVDGRFLIFDVVKNKYFLNTDGRIGSIGDYLKGNLVLSDEESARYKEFLDGITNIDLSNYSRTDEQMPFRRVAFEFKKIFKRGNKASLNKGGDGIGL